MKLLKRLNRESLLDFIARDCNAWLERIAREQEQRTVSRKRAQQAKAMKKEKK